MCNILCIDCLILQTNIATPLSENQGHNHTVFRHFYLLLPQAEADLGVCVCFFYFYRLSVSPVCYSICNDGLELSKYDCILVGKNQ